MLKNTEFFQLPCLATTNNQQPNIYKTKFPKSVQNLFEQTKTKTKTSTHQKPIISCKHFLQAYSDVLVLKECIGFNWILHLLVCKKKCLESLALSDKTRVLLIRTSTLARPSVGVSLTRVTDPSLSHDTKFLLS